MKTHADPSVSGRVEFSVSHPHPAAGRAQIHCQLPRMMHIAKSCPRCLHQCAQSDSHAACGRNTATWQFRYLLLPSLKFSVIVLRSNTFVVYKGVVPPKIKIKLIFCGVWYADSNSVRSKLMQ